MRGWSTWTDRSLSAAIISTHLLAFVLILCAWSSTSWLYTDTTCVTTLDHKNKKWQNCSLEIGLSKRCIFMDNELLHCDEWHELSVTIHMIDIPFQTDIFPARGPEDFGLISVGSIMASCVAAIAYCFGRFVKTCLCVAGVSTVFFVFCFADISYNLARAIVDHRPPVNYGVGRTLYQASFIAIVAGLFLLLLAHYFRRRSKSSWDHVYSPVAHANDHIELAERTSQDAGRDLFSPSI